MGCGASAPVAALPKNKYGVSAGASVPRSLSTNGAGVLPRAVSQGGGDGGDDVFPGLRRTTSLAFGAPPAPAAPSKSSGTLNPNSAAARAAMRLAQEQGASPLKPKFKSEAPAQPPLINPLLSRKRSFLTLPKSRPPADVQHALPHMDDSVLEHCADGRSGGVQSLPNNRTLVLLDAHGDTADEMLFVDRAGRLVKRVAALPALDAPTASRAEKALAFLHNVKMQIPMNASSRTGPRARTGPA